MTETPLNKPVSAHASADERGKHGETEILDYDALVNRCLGNLELARRLVERLQTYMPLEIEDMEKALTEKDTEQVARIAHGLKGATANVSAQGLNRVLEEIERFGRSGALSDISAAMERLHGEWERFKNYPSTILPPR